jgi:hypothetical protein
MKKTILFGLASAALLAVGCTNDETVEIPATKAITFANTFVDNNTKADPSVTTATITAFDVYGYVTKGGTESSKIFDGTTVSLKDGKWGYTDTQYWIEGGKYVFAAISPSGTKVTETLSNKKDTITTKVADFDNGAAGGKTDLLYSTATATGEVSGNKDVTFTFKHLLSKVKFTFKNGFDPTSNISLKITDVQITDAVKVATVETTDGTKDKTTWDWEDDNTNITSLNFGDVIKIYTVDGKEVEEPVIAPESSAEAIDKILLIPTSDRNYTVTFNVEIYQGITDPISTATHTIKAKIYGQEFSPGYAYNIVATLDQTNVNYNEGTQNPIALQSINLVPEVDEWIDEKEDGTATVQRPVPPDES